MKISSTNLAVQNTARQLRPFDQAVLYFVSALIISTFAAFVQTPLSAVDGVFASLIVVALLWTGIYYLGSSRQTLPFLPYALLHISVFFSLPVFWPTVSFLAWPSHQPYFRYALLLIFMLAIVIVISYGFTKSFSRKSVSKLSRLIPEISRATRQAPFLILSLAIVGIIARASTTLAIGTDLLGPFAFVLVSAFDPYFMFAILIYCQVKEPNRKSCTAAVTLFALLLAYGAFVAQIHVLIKPLIIVFVARLVLQRKLTWSFVVLAALLFVILNPVKNEYRRSIRAGESLTIEFVWDAWQSAWTSRSTDIGRNSDPVTVATRNRLNELIYLANVIEAVPQRIPHQYGYPWRTMLVAYIPRIFWPQKPDLREAYPTRWGVQMTYIQPFQHHRLALNLPLPVDGYWNFGVFGVVLVGVIFGFVIGTLENLSRVDGCMTFSLGMAFFVSIHANNSLGVIVGAIPAVIVLLSIVVVAMNMLTSMMLITASRRNTGGG